MPRSVKFSRNRPERSTDAATGTKATSSNSTPPKTPTRGLPKCLRNASMTCGRTPSERKYASPSSCSSAWSSRSVSRGSTCVIASSVML
ncbi:Uncharacterised protein [Mycobacteroides abscessus subsp. abscessus]|nr:Uncharacterised protein [Mycobacteroides abscessus subsp. abscessus]